MRTANSFAAASFAAPDRDGAAEADPWNPLAPETALARESEPEPGAWGEWLEAARAAFEQALQASGEAEEFASPPWDGFAEAHRRRVEADVATRVRDAGASASSSEALDGAIARQARAARDLERRARTASKRRRLDRTLETLSERAARRPGDFDGVLDEARAAIAATRAALAPGEDAEALRRWGDDAARAAARRAVRDTPRRALAILSSPALRARLEPGERARLAAVARARGEEEAALDEAREAVAFGEDRARLQRGEAARIDLDEWVEAADADADRRRRERATTAERAARAEASADHERWAAARWSPPDGAENERLHAFRRSQKRRLAADPAGEAWEHPRLADAARRLGAADAAGDGALGALIAEGLALQERLAVTRKERRRLPRLVAARIAQALTESAAPVAAMRSFARAVGTTARGRLVETAGDLSDEGLPAPLAAMLLDANAPAAAARLERLERTWTAAEAQNGASPQRQDEVARLSTAMRDALTRSLVGAALAAIDEPAAGRASGQLAAYGARIAGVLEPTFGAAAPAEALRLMLGDELAGLSPAPDAPEGFVPPRAANDNEPDEGGDVLSIAGVLDAAEPPKA